MACQYRLILFIFFLTFNSNVQSRTELTKAKKQHKPADLSRDQIITLASKTDIKHFERTLDNILVPRVVGTPEHQRVADFIVSELEVLDWTVERDKFTDNTPIFGVLEFENIIATLNPNADRFLVLACHYDSKYMREHNFVGATDSAVPCSMMLNLAKTMNEYLKPMRNSKDLSLALLFLDGEEAFQTWTDTDSIYGARHLASKWENQLYTTRAGSKTNNNERIDLFVLLDLIGVRNPRFYSFFPETKRWFNLLTKTESILSEMRMLEEYDSIYFSTRSVSAHIEDDHIPFLRRQVPILHLIPTPFPNVWHQPSDNKAALHANTIENLNKILRIFVAQYLNLDI